MQDARLGPEATAAEQNAVVAEVIERALAAGEESVMRGPDLLPVLREAGVVDAGGYGLTVLLAGIVGALRGTAPPPLEHHAPARVTHPQHASSTYRYCTNFAVTGSDLEARRFVMELEQPRRLGARGRRLDDPEDPRPHRRPRSGHGPVRRRRRGLASRRGRHARSRSSSATSGSRRRPSPTCAACSRWRPATGMREPVREPRGPRPRRRPDAQPVDLRPAGGDPRDPRRAGRRAAQQPQRRDGRRARRRAVGQDGARGHLPLAAGRPRRRGQPRPDAQRPGQRARR